jgi:hypothetical protein
VIFKFKQHPSPCLIKPAQASDVDNTKETHLSDISLPLQTRWSLSISLACTHLHLLAVILILSAQRHRHQEPRPDAGNPVQPSSIRRPHALCRCSSLKKKRKEKRPELERMRGKDEEDPCSLRRALMASLPSLLQSAAHPSTTSALLCRHSSTAASPCSPRRILAAANLESLSDLKREAWEMKKEREEWKR